MELWLRDIRDSHWENAFYDARRGSAFVSHTKDPWSSTEDVDGCSFD